MKAMPRYGISSKALTVRYTTVLLTCGVTYCTVPYSHLIPILHYSRHLMSPSVPVPLLQFLTLSHLYLSSILSPFLLSPFSLLLSSTSPSPRSLPLLLHLFLFPCHPLHLFSLSPFLTHMSSSSLFHSVSSHLTFPLPLPSPDRAQHSPRSRAHITIRRPKGPHCAKT